MGRQAWALVAPRGAWRGWLCADTAGELLEHHKQASGGVRWGWRDRPASEGA